MSKKAKSARNGAGHYLGLEAATLRTEAFALAHMAVADCVAKNAMGALYGAAGNGKTFAVRSALEGVSDREVIIVDCQVSMTYKGLIEMLLEAVSGGLPHRGTRAQLERILARELATRPRVICIDEAQRLTTDGIEILRSLFDDPSSELALLLVGGNNCWRVLSSQPMLRSRIHRAVEFRPLTDAEVRKLLPRFHPLLKDATKDVLTLVNSAFAHGNLRNWANFMATAEGLCARHKLPTVTEPVVRNAFTLLNSAPRAAA